ncbi:hypothetical protein ACFYV5_31225 [Streptomyces sp. NPDC003035]|uniref:hypothetical protein n=1 Tax=Streptomyces sp. NPDC003035 TaxID=3364676 RepID=UPI0036B046CD
MAHETPADAPAMTMAVLFDPEPERWGLRGDTHVWRTLRERLSHTEVPPSVDDVTALLRAAFDQAVGVDLARDESEAVYRKEYAHGGMSSGMVHLKTWRERLMPLLTQRAKALLAH